MKTREGYSKASLDNTSVLLARGGHKTLDDFLLKAGGGTITAPVTFNGATTFSNPILGDLLGNSTTADRLKNPVTINGVRFDGSSNITILASANGGNADTVDGLHVHENTNNEANKIVRTDANGHIRTGYIHTISEDLGTKTIDRIFCSNDGFIKYKTPANFISGLDLMTLGGALLVSGTKSFGDIIFLNPAKGDILGNATTADRLKNDRAGVASTGWQECKIEGGVIKYYNSNSNTWNANALNVAGYVAAPTASNKNQVWKTDANGNPAWRDDTDYDVTVLLNATDSSNSDRYVPFTASQSAVLDKGAYQLYFKSSYKYNPATNTLSVPNIITSGTINAKGIIETDSLSVTTGNLVVRGGSTLTGDVSLGTVKSGIWNGSVISSAYIGAHTHGNITSDGKKASYSAASDSGKFLNASGVWTEVSLNITSHLYAGASGATKNATTDVYDPYLVLVEGSSKDSEVQLEGAGTVTVSAKNGKITISGSAHTNSDTVDNQHAYEFVHISTEETITGKKTFSNPISGSLLGNATTADRLKNPVSIKIGSTSKNFDGSSNVSWTLSEIGAASATHSHTYNVDNSWLRENGDDTYFKIYGNTRQVVFRTDGTAQYSNLGAYPFAFIYGGDANSNRLMLISDKGDIWGANIGWISAIKSTADKALPKTGGTVTGPTTFSSSVSIDSLTAGNLTVSGASTLTGDVSLGTVKKGIWNGTALTSAYLPSNVVYGTLGKTDTTDSTTRYVKKDASGNLYIVQRNDLQTLPTIVDNLTSTSTTSCLSANLGRILNLMFANYVTLETAQTIKGAKTFSNPISGSLLGTATYADRLSNARTISITGAVTGSGSFDGSSNLSISTSVNHNHNSSYVTALGTNGNYLTWTKNGTTNNITVPFASIAGLLSAITTSDNASSTDTWRRVWFSCNDNTTGRPAYSNTFAYLSSTGTLKVNRLSTGVGGIDSATIGNLIVSGATTLTGSTNAGTITASSFVGPLTGNASTATTANGLMGVNYSSGDSNIIKAFWNTKSDSRWYLQSANTSYLCRVDYATSAGSSSSAGCISYTGTGNGVISAYQTSNTYMGTSGWATYIICNHEDGATYYNQTIRMPFWDAPQYQRKENGTDTGWYTFVTSENYTSYWPSSLPANGGTSTAANKVNIQDVRDATRNTSYFEAKSATFWFNQTGTPSGDWYSGIHMKGLTDGYQSWEICSGSATSLNGTLYYRNGINDSWQSWRTVCILDTSNNLTIAGSYYANSDIRYKSLITALDTSIESIASLPIFKYTWNDDKHDTNVHIGSSALAVMTILPELVTKELDRDFYNLDYATLGVVASITTAKELVIQKSELEICKEKIKQLELRIKELENV